MTDQTGTTPPRRMEPGDIVAAFSEPLGEWTAAQITDLDAGGATAGVLELDWSGPEPDSVTDLGDVSPLRLSHHSWGGKLSHCNHQWVLPRSHKVIGSLPILHAERSNSYGGGWRLGHQLFLQRRWDRGERAAWTDPQTLECTGRELERSLAEPAEPDREIRRLTVRGVDALDVGRLVARFPELTALSMWGKLGTLTHASKLNDLTALKHLFLKDLFGMDAADCLLPGRVAGLESLELHSIPAEYATVMRSTWQREIPGGTYVEISKPRRPGWAAENRDNPLREWDGDDYIPQGVYEQASAQCRRTRDALMEVLSGPLTEDGPSRVFAIGEQFGEAFNRLDEQYEFIDTVERERLFDVLGVLAADVATRLGIESPWVQESLAEGTESVRDW